MPERTTVIESDNPPTPAPSDRLIDLATEVGAMRVESQTTRGELNELRSGQAQVLDLLRSQSEIISELRSQTASAQQSAESAQVTAAVAVETATEEREEENEGAVLNVTPEVETRVEITQTPIKQRKWIHNLIYGK